MSALKKKISFPVQWTSESKKKIEKYLGLPITNHRPKTSDYQYIIDHINRKLSGWKSRFLSLARITTLVKSVVASIPTYTMKCNLLPLSIRNHIDYLQRNFLWGSTPDKRKLHLANWDLVTTPLKAGGLDVQKINGNFFALLASLYRRFLRNKEHLWANVL